METESTLVTPETVADMMRVTRPFTEMGTFYNPAPPFFDLDTYSFYEALAIPTLANYRVLKVQPSDSVGSVLYTVNYLFTRYEVPSRNIYYDQPATEVGISTSEDLVKKLFADSEKWYKDKVEQDKLGLGEVTEDDVRLIISAFERFNNLR